MDGTSMPAPVPVDGGWRAPAEAADTTTAPALPESERLARAAVETVRTPAAGHALVPLVRLAWARSGDKGDNSNIGLIARRPEYLPILLEQVTAAAVRDWFAHMVKGEVKRYRVPGIHGCNFLLFSALDGGGTPGYCFAPGAPGEYILELGAAGTFSLLLRGDVRKQSLVDRIVLRVEDTPGDPAE